jgi:dolichyldiphosphatase
VVQAVSLSQPVRYIAAGAITAYWIGGIWSRIELGYHTYGQCFGGIGLGIVLAALWRAGWDSNAWIGTGLQGLINHIWGMVFH